MGMSIRAYARHRGVSAPAVLKAIKTGRITREPDGTIDPAMADAAWERNTDPAQQRREEPPSRVRPAPPAQQQPPPPVSPAQSSGAVPAYQTSRAVKETYAARLTKLEFEERTGELVKADDVRVEAFNLARRVRDRLLILPHRLAAVLAAETDADRTEKILEGELRKALEELTR